MDGRKTHRRRTLTGAKTSQWRFQRSGCVEDLSDGGARLYGWRYCSPTSGLRFASFRWSRFSFLPYRMASGIFLGVSFSQPSVNAA